MILVSSFFVLVKAKDAAELVRLTDGRQVKDSALQQSNLWTPST